MFFVMIPHWSRKLHSTILFAPETGSLLALIIKVSFPKSLFCLSRLWHKSCSIHSEGLIRMMGTQSRTQTIDESLTENERWESRHGPIWFKDEPLIHGRTKDDEMEGYMTGAGLFMLATMACSLMIQWSRARKKWCEKKDPSNEGLFLVSFCLYHNDNSIIRPHT